MKTPSQPRRVVPNSSSWATSSPGGGVPTTWCGGVPVLGGAGFAGMRMMGGRKNKYELLREEKNDMEMEYEERLKQMDDKHQHELLDAKGFKQGEFFAR